MHMRIHVCIGSKWMLFTFLHCSPTLLQKQGSWLNRSSLVLVSLTSQIVLPISCLCLLSAHPPAWLLHESWRSKLHSYRTSALSTDLPPHHLNCSHLKPSVQARASSHPLLSSLLLLCPREEQRLNSPLLLWDTLHSKALATQNVQQILLGLVIFILLVASFRMAVLYLSSVKLIYLTKANSQAWKTQSQL